MPRQRKKRIFDDVHRRTKDVLSELKYALWRYDPMDPHGPQIPTGGMRESEKLKLESLFHQGSVNTKFYFASADLGIRCELRANPEHDGNPALILLDSHYGIAFDQETALERRASFLEWLSAFVSPSALSKFELLPDLPGKNELTYEQFLKIKELDGRLWKSEQYTSLHGHSKWAKQTRLTYRHPLRENDRSFIAGLAADGIIAIHLIRRAEEHRRGPVISIIAPPWSRIRRAHERQLLYIDPWHFTSDHEFCDFVDKHVMNSQNLDLLNSLGHKPLALTDLTY